MNLFNIDFQVSFNEIAIWQVFLLILLGVSSLLTLYRVYLRLYKHHISRFSLVVFLNLSATAAISALLLQPLINNNQVQTATLMTPIGMASKTAEQANVNRYMPKTVIKAEENNVYYLASHQAVDLTNNESVISSAAQVLIRQPNLGQLHLTGHGLYQQQLQYFNAVELSFTAEKITPGFSEMRWSQNIVLGQPLKVQGRYFSSSSVKAKVKLFDLAGKELASQTVQKNQAFTVLAQPKSLGRYEYYLELSTIDGQLIDRQQLKVAVRKGRAIKLMIMQSAPSFESKQLAQWAGQQGAEVIIHTQISKNKFIDKRVNIDSNFDIKFGPALLASQDLLIIDGRSFVGLSSNEKQQLNQAINDGLGLLVLADESLIKTFESSKPPSLQNFDLRRNIDVTEPVYPKWLNSELFSVDVNLPLLAATIGVKMGNVLVWHNKFPLIVSSPVGLGKSAISILREQFRWVTHGEIANYSHFWQNIFMALSRPDTSSAFAVSNTVKVKMVYQAQQICLNSNNAAAVKLEFKHQLSQQVLALPLNQKQAVKNQYCAFYWPTLSGWYQFSLRNSNDNQLIEQKNIYIYSLNDWISWQQYQKVTATKTFVESHNLQLKAKIKKATFEKIDPLYFWWLLIFSASFLWLETKIATVFKKS